MSTIDRTRDARRTRRRTASEGRSASVEDGLDAGRGHAVARIQRTHGNRAVNRLRERGTSHPSLTVSSPTDPAEREAERVADRVMRASPRSFSSGAGTDDGRSTDGRPVREAHQGAIQRMCARCRRRHERGKSLDCEECEAELARTERSAGPEAVSGPTAAQIRSVRGGSPLPEATRSFFESRFGADFSAVRVHTGSRADEAARSVNATAFTLGTDVVFRSGAYRPGTEGGKRLLAHELTHVVQQRGGRSQSGTVPLGRSTASRATIQRECVDGEWRFECDGCSVPEEHQDKVADKDNPTGHPDTVFGNESPDGRCRPAYTAPCDEHDRCYQTCGADKDECDREFRDAMQAVCEAAGNPEGSESIWGWNPNCSSYARIYYEAVKRYGGDAFEERQRQACACERRQPDESDESRDRSVTDESRSRPESDETAPIELEPTRITATVYTVTRGDTLWDVAEREYGDGRKWPVIFEANRKSAEQPDGIEDPDRIYPGQRLIIPPRREADAFERREYDRPR